MKKYLLNILVWLLFWTHGAEETITVENADFRIDSNRKRIPAWNVQAARWKPVKTSDDIPGLMITLRKWGEGRFQTVATYNIANPEAGSYCYSLMIRLDSDNVETIQFYLPLTIYDFFIRAHQRLLR